MSADIIEMEEALAFRKAQRALADAALAKKGRFAKYYEAEFQIIGARRPGTFIMLVCKACNRWEDAGHDEDCSTAELERMVQSGG